MELNEAITISISGGDHGSDLIVGGGGGREGGGGGVEGFEIIVAYEAIVVSVDDVEGSPELRRRRSRGAAGGAHRGDPFWKVREKSFLIFKVFIWDCFLMEMKRGLVFIGRKAGNDKRRIACSVTSPGLQFSEIGLVMEG